MPRPAYPTKADLVARFEDAGLPVTAAAQARFEGYVSAAIADLEGATERRFLAVDGTRTFDPPTGPSGVLLFGADLAAAPSSVTVAGTAYALGSDFRLLDANAAAEGWPYSGLRLMRRWTAPLSFAEEGSVSVTGLWGFAEEVPDDVWDAVLARAGWLAWPQVAQQSTGGLKSWREKDRSEDFGDTTERLRQTWAGEDGQGGAYGAAVKKYARWSMR